VTIGAGPAGEAAAMVAAKEGKKVLMIDNRPYVGGNCTHVGTIPSKALRQAVFQIMRFNNDNMFRSIGKPTVFSFPNVLSRAKQVITKQVKLRSTFYGRNNVPIVHGDAKFIDSQTIEVSVKDGTRQVFESDNFAICTGSRPYRPPELDFGHPAIFDSDTILDLQQTPRKIIIYGAGVIGCEYACIFNGLGVRVELINTRDQLLDFLDDEISDALSYHLRDTGVLIRHGEEFESMEYRDNDVVVKFKSGKRTRADAFLWCNGRTGNTDLLNLESVGLNPNPRGQLEVNQDYQTEVPHLYAAGDVIGWPSLASAAYDQGCAVGARVAQIEDFKQVTDVPTGIYTIPEISSIGKTEKELTEEKVPYEVGQAFFKTLAKAQISGMSVGMLKILFHAETLEILGVHCFGDSASEIIHIGQAIMNQPSPNNSMKYFTQNTFNYPTMAEAYRVAALNGLNRIKYL
jgi:NAD(P) transhydrogenase